jgi:MFS family permease
MSDQQFKITNNHSFFGFLISNIISTFGNGLRETILPLAILDITKYPHLMGLTYTISYAIFIIATPFSGFIVDKIKKKSSLIISDIIRGVLIGSIPLILMFLPSFSIIWIIIVVTGMTIGDTIFKPAALSIIPELIEEKSIDRANALINLIIS